MKHLLAFPAHTMRLSLALAAGLTAMACGDDSTASKEGDTDAQVGSGGAGGEAPQGGSGGETPQGGSGGSGPVGGTPQGGNGGGIPAGGEGGGNVKPDGGLGGEPAGGAGGEPVGGTPAGGAGGEPVGGSPVGGSPVGGSGGAGGEPVGGQPAPGGQEPPPPVPDGDYAYGRIGNAAIANAGEPSCPDFTRDGQSDNAFAGLGPIVNGQLQQAITDASLNLLPVSIGLPAGARDGQFAIAVLTGSDNPDGSYTVSDSALDANGDPLILFNPAEAMGGNLQAGPGNFQLGLPVQGQNVVLNLTQASITGTIAVDNNAGLTIGTGTIAGQISQADLDAALVVVPPEFVGLIPLFLQADIDSDGDRVADAYSICLTFDASPAVVSGFPLP